MIFHPSNKTLFNYLDQELSEARQTQIARHLEQCESCRKKLELLKGVGERLTREKPSVQDIKEQFMNRLEHRNWINTPICAEIRAVKGEVLVSHNKNDEGVEVFPGMALRKGDTLRVAEKSLALVELTDGSLFYLNRKTEFRFSDSQYPVHLSAGEFFAMMKPQRSVFRIQTPSAVLGVIGTDFDARVTNENKTVLKVLKGKVSFENEAGSVIVKKKRQVEAGKYTPPHSTQILHLRSVADWRNQIKPAKGKKGIAMNKLLVWIIIIGLVGGAYLYSKKGSDKDLVSSEVKPEILEDKNDPMNLVSHYSLEGLAWKMTIRSDMKSGAAWVNNSERTIRQEVMETDSQRGITMLLIIEEIREQGDQQEMARQVIGKRYKFRLTPEGNVRDIGTYSGEPLNDVELPYLLNAVGSSETFGIFSQKPVVPGDSWTLPFDAQIPDFPGFFLKGETTSQFTGYQKRKGKEVAVIKTDSTISMGGITLEYNPRPGMKVVLEVKNTNMKIQRENIIDMKTGRVIAYTGFDMEFDKQMIQTEYIKGRRKPIRTNIGDNKQMLSRVSCAIEYLD